MSPPHIQYRTYGLCNYNSFPRRGDTQRQTFGYRTSRAQRRAIDMRGAYDGLYGLSRYDESEIYTPGSTPREEERPKPLSTEPLRAAAPSGGVQDAAGLAAVREVARAICAGNTRGDPYLIPPHPWWKETPVVHRTKAPQHDIVQPAADCELESLAAQGRKAPVHITFHPDVQHGPIRSSEHLALLLEAEGLQCSWAPEYHAGDRAMAQHAIVVVLLLSEKNAHAARTLRIAEYAAKELGKIVVPVTLGAATWREDEQLSEALAGIRSVDFDVAPQSTNADTQGSAAEAGKQPIYTKPWRALVTRLYAAVRGRGADAPGSFDGGVFVGYHARNSQLLHEYGHVGGFEGPAAADPLKIADLLRCRGGMVGPGPPARLAAAAGRSCAAL
jgi:hypothetical protein